MQNFNQLSSLWQSQDAMPQMANAREMLEAVRGQVVKMKRKNYFNIIVLVCTALVFLGFNLLFDFEWTTHLGLALITLGIVSVLVPYFQLQKLLSTIDYSQNSISFIVRFKEYQQKRFKIYRGYYWWYLVLLVLGTGLCVFEFSKMYSTSFVCIFVLCTVIWMVLCSVWVRKLTLQKIRQEHTFFLEKLKE